MFNKVILIGRLTQDPEMRYTPSGMQVASFTLAINRWYNNRQGEKVEDTTFIDIVAWQKLAETCAKYLGKGSLVVVEGRLQSRSYDDKQGIRRKVVEVVANDVRFLNSTKDTRGQVSGGHKTAEGEQFASEISFNEEDIPF